LPSSQQNLSATAPCEAKAQLVLPIVAIGGINPENAPPLIAAGADAVAVISDLFGKDDIQTAAKRYSLLFSS
jgi:thiamine-phosphate pyrophosphorylase